MSNHPQISPAHHGSRSSDAELPQQIAQALSGLRFGSVEIIVHEGKVTQIERKEKFRLQA